MPARSTRRTLLKTAGFGLINAPLLSTLLPVLAQTTNSDPLVAVSTTALVNMMNNIKAGHGKATDMAQVSGVLSGLFASWQKDGTLAKLQNAVTRQTIASFNEDPTVTRQRLFTVSRNAGANVELSDFDHVTIDKSTINPNVAAALAETVDYFSRAAVAFSAAAVSSKRNLFSGGHVVKAYLNTCTFLGAILIFMSALDVILFPPAAFYAALLGLLGAGFVLVGEFSEISHIDLC